MTTLNPTVIILVLQQYSIMTILLLKKKKSFKQILEVSILLTFMYKISFLFIVLRVFENPRK